MIDFEDLMERFYNPLYCDIDERPLLRRALQVLCERMPVAFYDELPDIILFAPAPWKYGMSPPMPRSTDTEAALMYLSPRLEEEDQEQNNFTVAHEFAHVALRHHAHSALLTPEYVEYLEHPNEIAADALAKQWGYEIPAYRSGSA